MFFLWQASHHGGRASSWEEDVSVIEYRYIVLSLSLSLSLLLGLV